MKKTTIDSISKSLTDNYNVLILSSSFESRCRTISMNLHGFHFDKVIIVENTNGSETIKNNGSEMQKQFDSSVVLEIDFSNQLGFAHELIKEISEIPGEKISVLIDITTFTHESLLVCLKTLYCNTMISCITCLYLNASEYCKDKTVAQKWLSRGAKSVHPIFRYSGMLYPSLETHLIVIVGYEYERAFEVISQIEPNSLTLIYGSTEDAITERDKGANQHYHHLLEDMAFEYSNIESCIIDCYDPRKTANDLLEIYAKYSDKNIIVIPMNNKMSTVGVFLSEIENDDIQVCYASAVIYNEENYSEPGNDCYIFDLK